ncbi:MAG: hypothetical protein IK079_05750 [Desulfovibrio sp.]|nr:hypothetical protein [Desulfovibrio sp.]
MAVSNKNGVQSTWPASPQNTGSIIRRPAKLKFCETSDVNWEQNTYYQYRQEAYCQQQDGEVYRMLPVEDPSIGYKLVTTSVEKNIVLTEALPISEKDAIDLIFREAAREQTLLKPQEKNAKELDESDQKTCIYGKKQ